MKTLTVFTPTYNRAHTLVRTYESLCRQTSDDFDWLIIDDGSSDETRIWVESLGEKKISKGRQFDWMGRMTSDECDDHFIVQTDNMTIEYIYKPNGGLYTGYNVAYATIQTELCVCIDSDDFMPHNAVEKIVTLWRYKGNTNYCGIIGLDFRLDTGTPIGGYFPANMTETYRSDLFVKQIHCGDSKEVMRTDLMRSIAPQIGFAGEKNFNPSYMLSQIWDKYPLLVINENLCIVDYQLGADSMSQGIYKQYVNSSKSFAKHRILHMKLKRYPYSMKFLSAAHYISSCILSRDTRWLKNTPMKITTLLAIPLGLCIYTLIKIKTWK